MKRFCILIGVVCFIVLSIHTSSSRAVESWIPPEPSNEMAANGGESLVVSEDLRLVHESPRIWRELKFDNLLAQEEPHIPSAPSTEMVAEMKEEEGADTEEIDKIAEALANPLSYLWLLFTQNDTIWFDGDLMDDKFEVDNGFDPTNPSDGSGDADHDGLTNAEEYSLGLDLFSADSDNDLMDDKWEVENGLRPLFDDSMLDADGDGKTNLQEYLEETDPNVVERDPIPIIWLIAPLVMIASIVGFLYLGRDYF